MVSKDIKSIENLLLFVNLIAEKYDNEAQQTGIKFNIFNILDIRSKELKHSAFIAELLNPKGRHGYKERFLELFLEEVGIESSQENLKNANVEVEKVINGSRRIDIFIKIPNGTNIIIENKIYAGDQEYQLQDYHKSDTSAIILYLTLWGNAPSDNSIGDLTEESKEKIKAISYKEHIKNWLEKCFNEVENKPFIRENIAQYLNIVKELTNQSIFNNMRKEILEKLLTDAEMARGFFHLITNVSLEDWYREVFGVIKSRLNFYEFNEEATDESRGIFNFWRYKKEYDFCIFLEANKGGDNMRVGVAHLDIGTPSTKSESIKNALKNKNFQTDENNDEWICYKEIPAWNNTSWAEIVGKIDKVSEEIQGFVDKIVEVIREVKT